VKIAIVYDAGSGDWDPRDVAAVLENARSVRRALREGGHETSMVPVTLGDVKWLQRIQKADLVFNLCEGVNGLARYEDFAVAAMDLARVPFTGTTSWTVTIAHRKHIANTLLQAAGVPVPRFALVRGASIPADLRYPVIVKPSGEDASVGIDAKAVCTSRRALRERLAQVGNLWEEILVQEYVPGREVNVGFVGEEMLPFSEIEFRQLPRGCWPIVTYAAKWHTGSAEDLATVPVCPASLEPEVAERVGAAAIRLRPASSEMSGFGFTSSTNGCPSGVIRMSTRP
jgi:D-alanine-D-alanine ligase